MRHSQFWSVVSEIRFFRSVPSPRSSQDPSGHGLAQHRATAEASGLGRPCRDRARAVGPAFQAICHRIGRAPSPTCGAWAIALRRPGATQPTTPCCGSDGCVGVVDAGDIERRVGGGRRGRGGGGQDPARPAVRALAAQSR